MGHTKKIIRLTLFAASLWAGTPSAFAESSTSTKTYPKIFLSTSAMPFDKTCTSATGYSIDPLWIQELDQRFTEFTAAWERRSDELLRTTVELTGKNFARAELTATLSLCNLPSMSHPLIINVRYFLRSFTKQPQSLAVFTGIVFHELLHHLLTDDELGNSKLLRKYRQESLRVKAHLHLLAVQKAVYVTLGYSAELALIISRDLNLPNGDYRRAWEIVEKEGFQAFVDELSLSIPRIKVEETR